MYNQLHLEDKPFDLDNYGPIFILGCPRSGTTFLSQCIAAINNVEEFVGVLVPPRFMHLIASTDDTQQKENLLLITRDIFWQAFWRRRMFKHEKFIQVSKGNTALGELFKNPGMNNATFCYKEPFLCFAGLEFARHYPNSKFIHIIRDGRDNADSMNRTYPHALSDEILKDENLTKNNVSEIGIWRRYRGFSIPWWINEGKEDQFIAYSKYERNFLMWAEMVSRGRAIKSLVGAERYFEVKYEELVKDPLPVSQQILEFLGAGTNKRMNGKLKKAFSTSIGINKTNSSSTKLKNSEESAFALLKELGYVL